MIVGSGVDELLARYRPLVSRALEEALPPVEGLLGVLAEAMRYSVEAGGKRLRPALCLSSAEALGVEPEVALVPAVALELVHTYSLVHDDLPCMDDDDLRRGRPTSHKVYGEALAVLAGDGLLTRAFEILASAEGTDPAVRSEMIGVLARASGARGMVGGQALDLAAERSEDVDLPTLQYIHTHKTGALFAASCRLGGIAAGGSEQHVESLERFGEKIGLAFQIVDDLLDVTGGARELGKRSGKDAARGKATYPRLLGTGESRRRVEELAREAERIAEGFGKAGRGLSVLARFAVERTS